MFGVGCKIYHYWAYEFIWNFGQLDAWSDLLS